jgi:hypothetical protein
VRPLSRILLAAPALLVLGALLAGIPGCNVRKQGEGSKQKVDIQTPVGSFRVNTDVDPQQTGIVVYPGATRVHDDKDAHSANLNIDSNLFGLKVVAVKYRSDDPPEKLMDFYRQQLKSYGAVSVCQGSISYTHGKMQCRPGSDDDGEIKLVAGGEDRQHIVSVRPHGKGSEFGLIYIQARGEKETM